MIRSSDIDKLLNRREQEGETIADWCRRNSVDESAVHRVIEAFDASYPIVEAFRLGYDARREDEPRGTQLASRVAGESRHAVQFAVVDTASGRIVGNAVTNRSYANDLAATYNEVDSESAEDPRR